MHFQNHSHWDAYLDPIEKGQLSINRAYKPSDEERMTREMILQLKLGVILEVHALLVLERGLR